ncbi:hypothetical protein N7468_009523 [Penicillium chermesinum]|uniref:non-specific serine/threonine protein kinase n=1 Tax=Penicillium chermesinum TaxID=63820 RepID=A0A9W9NHW2_9EURO|nr:uncharacterized protein N7468_009523 [Penicillium chermesinum]KAJ5220319.1 hypothetical protein N7468_009523 [Penicillium chermesinum]KAJ6157762.1 hypothetical protein N7470_005354 [Penicillium chermesinum]
MTPTNSPMPLMLHTNSNGKDIQIHTPSSGSNLTPPVTPVGKEIDDSDRSTPSSIHHELDEPATLRQNVCTPLRFTDELEICRDAEERPIEFGRGAWSIVYKARATPSTGPMYTPPSSPAAGTRVYAVKAPLRRDARPVLQAEALTLTRLHFMRDHERYVVPFHGFHTDTKALVMTAVPLALSTYIEDQADLARKRPVSTATMFDPIQGPDSWRDMACKLISGLAWLHSKGSIFHGDIKPHNLLLRTLPTDEPGVEVGAFPYEPLLADFSSALDICGGGPIDANRASYSAFTPPFTAPELLSLTALKAGTVAPSPASDVFSLAATLVAAATGDLLLYPGFNSMQRLAMARDGHQILNFTRSGPNAARVPRNGFVERLIQPAVAKDPAQRIAATEWAALASSV